MLCLCKMQELLWESACQIRTRSFMSSCIMHGAYTRLSLNDIINQSDSLAIYVTAAIAVRRPLLTGASLFSLLSPLAYLFDYLLINRPAKERSASSSRPTGTLTAARQQIIICTDRGFNSYGGVRFSIYAVIASTSVSFYSISVTKGLERILYFLYSSIIG